MRRPDHLAFVGGIGLLIAFAACSSFREEVNPVTSPLEGGTPDGPSTEGSSEAAAPASPYREAVLADAPIAYWRMGIRNGMIVPDETPNGNALFLQGAGGFTLGAPGATSSDGDTAISFDGRTGGAIAEKPRVFDFPNEAPFTLECWARYQALAGGSTFPVLFSSVEGFTTSANGYLFYFVPGGKTVQFNYGPGAVLTGTLPVDSRWMHYAVIYDGTSASLVIDGTVIGTKPVTGGSSTRPSAFGVARRPQNDDTYFPGTMDEVAVYDKALELKRILAHIAAR
jgi:hypothetical protein